MTGTSCADSPNHSFAQHFQQTHIPVQYSSVRNYDPAQQFSYLVILSS